MSECIAAIATAPGTGGVAIIRISGDNSLEIAEKMFKPIGKTAVRDFEPYKLYVGEISGDGFTDHGMCVCFKSPKSFTGENVIEFHCHGGVAIAHGILNKAFASGARPATNGEYTKRAFLNGKLSLSSCEGLIDMINSESVAQIKSGFYLFKEKLKEKIIDIQSVLTIVLAGIDANIDYPEEGLIEDDGEEIKSKLLEIKPILIKMLNSYDNGHLITDGVKVALVGKTNTGKSSLLNSLTGENRAIVTEVAGTTRDVVEGKLFINGIKFNLYDTAGLRKTDDKVELLGIERSNDLISKADIILFVTDSEKITCDDEETLYKLKDKKVIKVYNKSDVNEYENRDKNAVYISAMTGQNIEKLKEMLFDYCAKGINTDGEYITQKRHYYALSDALSALDNAINAIGNIPLDLVAADIKECWSKLGEITGTTASEDIINEIFSRFCVGK